MRFSPIRFIIWEQNVSLNLLNGFHVEYPQTEVASAIIAVTYVVAMIAVKVSALLALG